MSNIQLSRDADYLICQIYKYYLELRDNGISKSEAKSIKSLEDIHYLVSNWSLDDIHETCLELANKNLLSRKKLIFMKSIHIFLFLTMVLFIWKIVFLTK